MWFTVQIPMMLQSAYCWLHSLEEGERAKMSECGFDQGGYFIINGMEKVLIAQEKMASNFVYVFKKNPPSKHSWMAEIRSQREGMQATSPFSVKLRAKQPAGGRSKSHGQIVAVLPYIRTEIPIVILFRALGVLSDRDICQRIVSDMNDKQMLNLLKPSLEEGTLYLTQNVCLDFIGRRGPTVGAPKELRIRYAREVNFLYLCFTYAWCDTRHSTSNCSYFTKKCWRTWDSKRGVSIAKLGS